MLRPFFPELVMSTDLLSFEHPSVLLFCSLWLSSASDTEKSIILCIVGFPGSEFSPSSSAKMLTDCSRRQMYSFRCFVCGGGGYDKILMETGKFSDSIRVTKNGLVSGFDRMQSVGDQLDPLRKSVNFDFLFLCPPSGILFWYIRENTKVLVPWIWDRFPVFGALLKRSLSFILRTVYCIEITSTCY